MSFGEGYRDKIAKSWNGYVAQSETPPFLQQGQASSRSADV